MAIEFITAVWQISPYKAEKLLIQLACADWADAEGNFWPSYSQIAHRARTTERGAIGIIEQMLAAGDFILTAKGSGRGKPNKYQFGSRYLEAVEEVRKAWSVSRRKHRERVKDIHPLGERVKEEAVNAVHPLAAERVNEAQKKGEGEVAHIRKIRHEETVKEETVIAVPRKARKPDPLYRAFVEHYEADYGCPYQARKADFVQLAACKSQGNGWLNEERWRQGVEHYFESVIGNHTLADLCARFGAFYRSALDQFGKPIGVANDNGAGKSLPKGNENGKLNPIRESRAERNIRESHEYVEHLCRAAELAEQGD